MSISEQDKRIEAERRFAKAIGRILILRSLLPSFISWLESQGHSTRDSMTFGAQIKDVKVGDHWMSITKNRSFTAHYVVDKRMHTLLLHFLAELRPPVANAAE